jgi:radical SAM protein with 4Fe4S-binding SPASM domain
MTDTNEVRIETCTYCNYKCKFCPHSTKDFKRERTLMGPIMFETILKKIKVQAPQITDCTVSGFGEPMLDRKIMEKIRIARNMEYNVHVLTNGSVISKDEIIEMTELGVASLRFSLHSVVENDYKKIVGTDYANLTNVLEIINFAILNKCEMNIIITADVVEENKNVELLIDKFKGKDVLIEVWKPHNWVNWANYRNGPIIKKTCGRPFKGPLQIQVDGTVNMCCFDFNGELLIGDFKNQTLEEIFNSNEYLTIKKHHEDGTILESNLICKDCDQLKDTGSILIYSNKFKEEDRVGKTSTNYRSVL